MASIDYGDSYLLPRIDKNPEWEERARADVAALGAFPEYWADRLVMLRVYITCCLESLAREDDVFSVKLREYRAEYKAALTEARAAAAIPDPAVTAAFFSVPLTRS